MVTVNDGKNLEGVGNREDKLSVKSGIVRDLCPHLFLKVLTEEALSTEAYLVDIFHRQRLLPWSIL